MSDLQISWPGLFVRGGGGKGTGLEGYISGGVNEISGPFSDDGGLEQTSKAAPEGEDGRGDEKLTSSTAISEKRNRGGMLSIGNSQRSGKR